MEAILRGQIVTPAAKKRNRVPLSSNAYNSRYEADSQPRDYFQSIRGVLVTAEKSAKNHLRAKSAAEESRITDAEVRFCHSELLEEGVKYPNFLNERRVATKYLFTAVFGTPPIEDWHRMKLVPVISHILNIPRSSHSRVHELLDKVSSLPTEFSWKRH